MLGTLTDAERYPTLTTHGKSMLDSLRQHPHAPIYRNHAGNRLTADDLAKLRAFETEAGQARIEGNPGARPPWLAAFVAHCYAEVPYFRRLGAMPGTFESVPTTTRAELARDITLFVPDNVALERLINFRTSGTTGHPLVIPSHPLAAASYIAFYKRALRRFGIDWHSAGGRVGVVLLGHQRQCFTYTSVIPSMDDAGYAKINLHPDDWRDPEDRARYLDALQPELFSGDPLSFAALLELPVNWRPRALVSTAMTLSPALRAQLEARFECPVLDVYSMTESGPVAVADSRSGGFALLQHRLLVEVLDATGAPCPPAVCGEITLTGGFNSHLPLLRYRTGDYAALTYLNDEWLLTGLSGRPAVRFRAANGIWINSIEFSHALRRLPLYQFRLHQHADGRVRFEYAAATPLEDEIRAVLSEWFGTNGQVAVSQRTFDVDKIVQYSTDIASA